MQELNHGVLDLIVGSSDAESLARAPDRLVASKKFSIAVIFENSEDHEALFLELRDRGFKVKVI